MTDQFTISAPKAFLKRGTRVTVFGDRGTVKKAWRDRDGEFYAVEMDRFLPFAETTITVRACNVKELV